MATFALLLVVLALAVCLGLSVGELFKLKAKLARYSGINDLEQHKQKVGRAAEDAERKRVQASQQLTELEQKLTSVRADLEQNLASARAELEQSLASARAELESVEESLDLQSFGLYRPRYGLASSTEYQELLDAERDRQKRFVKNDQATDCPSNWTVDGSVVKGRKMVAEHAKLMLRAFNGECDAAITKVKYNNAVALENRIRKAFGAINKLGKAKGITITEPYLASKLAELHVVHELHEKLQAEREEQRAIKEQIREEARAQREVEEAQKEAEGAAAVQEAALEQARKELIEATGQQHERLEQLVNKLEQELQVAIDRKAKAIARAQLTKSGHVYVISNIGSFGETFYKIGMTRRLDPMVRVNELGDASVPFAFDVHAMIFSENAPELESALHRRLETRRVNRVNTRKEFFRVTLDEVRQAVTELHGQITFVTVPEAEEYRKTVALEREERSRPHLAPTVPAALATSSGIRLSAPTGLA